MADLDQLLPFSSPDQKPSVPLTGTTDAPPPPAPPEVSEDEQRAAAREARETAGRVPRQRAQPQPAEEKPKAAPTREPTVEENLYERFVKGPQDNGPELIERARLNFVNSQYREAALGAAGLAAMAQVYRTPDAPGDTEEMKAARAKVRERYEEIVADLIAYDAMPSFSGLPQFGSAFAGALGGTLTSPEAFLGWASSGASWTIRTGKAALQQGIIGAAVDPATQMLTQSAGVEERTGWDPGRTLMAAAASAAIGGGFHALGEAAGAGARAVGDAYTRFMGQRELRKQLYELGTESDAFWSTQHALWALDPRNGIEVRPVPREAAEAPAEAPAPVVEPRPVVEGAAEEAPAVRPPEEQAAPQEAPVAREAEPAPPAPEARPAEPPPPVEAAEPAPAPPAAQRDKAVSEAIAREIAPDQIERARAAAPPHIQEEIDLLVGMGADKGNASARDAQRLAELVRNYAPFGPEPEARPAPEPAPAEPASTVVEVAPDRMRPSEHELADEIAGMLTVDTPLSAKMLQDAADRVYGGTLAEGRYTRDQLYDAIELGVNRYIQRHPDRFNPAVSPEVAKQIAADLAALKERLPTQTVRAGEKDAYQQFSTPPDYAYAANWVANLRPGDHVLEPSAGVGGLIVHSMNARVRDTTVNELSDKRRGMIAALQPGRITGEDAAQLHNILPEGIRPTVVVMNPPFSRAAERMRGRMVLDEGARHVEQALARLEPGGRLVAIVGDSMKPEGTAAEGRRGGTGRAFREWWDRIGQEYDVRANVGVDRDIYSKYGTSFPTRLLVIDKNPPSGRPPVTGQARDAAGLIDLLREVHDERVEPVSAEPGRPEVAAGGEGAAGARGEPAGATGGVGAGEGQRGGAAPAGAEPAGAPEPRVGGERAPGAEPAERGPVAAVEPEPVARGTGGEPAQPAARGEEPAGGGAGDRGADVRPDDSGERPDPGVTPASEPVLATERAVSTPADQVLTEAIYEPYRPQRVKIVGAKEHPGALVQSAAMAAVVPPNTDYRPRLPAGLVEKGALSDAQLEAVTYAGHAHDDVMPSGKRRGFFIGDGTGVGKGREIAGIILDNFQSGRPRAVWVSEKRALINDARRDWSGLDQSADEIIDHGKLKPGDALKAEKGILFTTYDTLKSAEQTKTADGKIRGKERVDQIVEWLGPDFDGVIAFDESHNLGNAVDQKGGRGVKKASQKALAGVALQDKLPKARVVYVSATGATEVGNLAYADRLGLWGEGTPFPNRDAFVGEVSKGGMAAMELVARDMKALGHYIARNLSYDGVEYARVEHTLTPDQRVIYDKLAEGWQVVLQNFNAAMEATGITQDGKTLNSRAKSALMSQFWGGHQRFFNQIITSMQMPSVIRGVERDLAEGRQAVLQLVNTMEAAQERALEKARARDGGELEDLDMTPRDQLMQMVERSYPVQQMEEFIDDNGNLRSRPAVDSKGNPVLNRQAVAARDRLLDQLGSVQVPDGPLEILLNHFGPDKVAEVTGRGQRVVRKPDESGQIKTQIEKRGAQANVADAELFQEGKRPILVFSEAGGTGRSYHAAVGTGAEQARRSHYLVQGGWRADKAVQGFGRTHRTNQASAPIFNLVTTDLQGQKRFISSIARRLGQLGALTKGERRTGDQGMFGMRDNLESTEARSALRQFFRDAADGQIEGITIDDLQTGMGLRLRDDNGALVEQLPEMSQFLNRVLSLTIDRQNQVFNAFSDRLDDTIARAAAAGTLDVGVETYKADRISKAGEQTVYTDPRSGAETKHVHLNVETRNHPVTFEDTLAGRNKTNGVKPDTFIQNERSGRVFAVTKATDHTDADGRITSQVRLTSPIDYQLVARDRITPDRWRRLTVDEARTLWDEQFAATPEFRKSDLHIITGAVLPIWDRIGGNPKIFRLQTDQGERMLGRVIPATLVDQTLQRLGAEAVKVTAPPAEIAGRILQGQTAQLANEWRIKRSLVAGEPRLELIGPDYRHGEELAGHGVFSERIAYKTRYFIPTEPTAAAAAIEGITKSRPVVSLAGESDEIMKLRRPGGPYPGELRRGDEGAAAVPREEGAELSPEQQGAVQSMQQQAVALARALDIPLRQGRLGAVEADTMGIYKSRSGVVRVREVPDFATVTHEIGHALEARIGLPMRDLIDLHKAELGRLDYEPDSDNPREGFAEWIRLRIGNPKGAEAEAPNFTIAFDTFMREHHPDILQTINASAEAYRAWLQAPSVNAVEATVRHIADKPEGTAKVLQDIKEQGLPATVNTVIQKSYTNLIDQYAPLERAVRDLARIIKERTGEVADIRAAVDPSIMIRSYDRTRQAALVQLQNGIVPYHQVTSVGPAPTDAINLAIGHFSRFGRWDQAKVDDFDHYLAARMSEYLWRRHDDGLVPNEPSPIKPGDSRQAMADLEARYPNFRQASDMIHEFMRGLRRKQFDAGLISKDLFDKLEGYEFYVPMRRDVSDKAMTGGAGGGRTTGERLTGQVRRLRGSERDILSPLENIKMAVYHVENDIRMNDIRRAMRDLAVRAGPQGGRFVEEIPAYEARRYTAPLEQMILTRARDIGLSKEDAKVMVDTLRGDQDIDGALMGGYFVMERAAARGEPVLFVWEGGVPRPVRVMSANDPNGHAIYEVMTAAPAPIADTWVNIVATAGSLLRGGIVTSPTFLLSNYVKDQLQVAMTRPGYIPFIGGLPGLVSELRQDHIATLRGYMGGEMSGRIAGAIEHQMTRDIQDLAQKGYWVQRVSSVKGALELMNLTETATRNSVFKQVYDSKIRQGLSPYEAGVEAGYQADDIMAFSRHGSKVLVLRNFIPFLNANVQGQDKYLWRTLIEPLAKKAGAYGGQVTRRDQEEFNRALYAWVMTAGAGITLGMVYGAIMADDEIIQDALPAARGRNVFIPVGNGRYFAMPKPFELGIGFTLGEYAWQGMVQKDPRWAKQFRDAAMESLHLPNPIENMPIVSPYLELKTNTSFFTGRPIVPERLENKAHPELEFNEKTSTFAKELGKLMGWSPMKVDYAFGAYFGTWGRDVLAASSTLDQDSPAAALDDVMFLRRFIKDGERMSGRARQFWDLMAHRSGKYQQDAEAYRRLTESTLVRGQPNVEATELLRQMPATEQAYVILSEAARPDGKPAFDADAKRLHPLIRAKEAVTLLGTVARDLSTNTLVPYREHERLPLDPTTRRKLIDHVRTLAGMEMRNAFVIVGEPGYQGRALYDVDDLMVSIRHLSPAVADEIATRYATAKVYSTEAIRTAWPRLRDDLVRYGSQAQIVDLVFGVRSQGYEFQGTRVRRPGVRRAPIAGTQP